MFACFSLSEVYLLKKKWGGEVEPFRGEMEGGVFPSRWLSPKCRFRQASIRRVGWIWDSRGARRGMPVKWSRQVHVSRRSPTGRPFEEELNLMPVETTPAGDRVHLRELYSQGTKGEAGRVRFVRREVIIPSEGRRVKLCKFVQLFLYGVGGLVVQRNRPNQNPPLSTRDDPECSNNIDWSEMFHSWQRCKEEKSQCWYATQDTHATTQPTCLLHATAGWNELERGVFLNIV